MSQNSWQIGPGTKLNAHFTTAASTEQSTWGGIKVSISSGFPNQAYLQFYIYSIYNIRIIFFNEVKTPFISFEFSFNSWLSKFKLFCIIYWVDIYKQFVRHTKYTHFLSTTISYFSLLWHFYGSNISCMNLCLTSILQRPHLWGGKLENRME